MDKRGEKKLVLMQVILVILGIAAVAYYSVIVSILGFRKDFSLVWVVGALGCFSLAFLLHKMGNQYYAGTSKALNVLIAVFVILIVFFAFIEGLILKTGFTKPDPGGDYMVVLGAQVNGTKVSRALRYRLDAAFEYAMDNKNTKVIVSGAQGYKEDITEAKAMRDYLVEKGLEVERVIMEDKSTNTNENIMYSKKLMDQSDYVVIVTNRFHLYRGVHIAKKQLTQKVEGLGADTGTMLFLNYYVREAFAIVKDRLMGHI